MVRRPRSLPRYRCARSFGFAGMPTDLIPAGVEADSRSHLDRHGRRRPATHDFLDWISKAVDGKPSSTMTRTTRLWVEANPGWYKAEDISARGQHCSHSGGRPDLEATQRGGQAPCQDATRFDRSGSSCRRILHFLMKAKNVSNYGLFFR